ncbi:MAG: putative metal-binding motif-containing protein, partial [Myxococcota bacterium]
MTTRLSLLTSLLWLSGCMVSQSEFEDALCQLDEDGDGDPRCGPSGTLADGDCDDSNPLMSTLREETAEMNEAGEVIGGAYDGFDNDCDGGDLLDVDGDKYAGISRAEYEAIEGGDPWPTDLQDGVDCHDLPIEGTEPGYEAQVYPGAEDTYYDGIDGDCSGGTDFDRDGDGFTSRYFVDEEGNLGTDCDDNDAAVKPGGVEVEFYDGVDDDCDGTNDYDPDGDGRLTDGYEDVAEIFRSKYQYSDLTWVSSADCLDLNDDFGTVGPTVTPANASASYVRTPGDGDCAASVLDGESCENTWYDGLDDACDDLNSRGEVLRNDFDQDQDGYLPDDKRGDFIVYVLRYAEFTNSRGQQPYRAAMIETYGDGVTVNSALAGAWFDAHDNDCLDTDPTVSPDGVEILGDTLDSDCDGRIDGAPFNFDRLIFTDPGPVRAVASDDYLALVLNATGGVDQDDGVGPRLPSTVMLSWDADETLASNLTIDTSPFAVVSDSDVLHRAVSVVGDGTNVFSATTWATVRTRLIASLSVPTTGVHFNTQETAVPQSRLDLATYTDGDLRCDDTDDVCWQVACDGDSIQWHGFERAPGMAEVSTGILRDVDADDCFVWPAHLSGDNTRVYAVDASGDFSSFELDGLILSPSTSDPLGLTGSTFVRSHDDWLIVGQSTGVQPIRTSGERTTGLSG